MLLNLSGPTSFAPIIRNAIRIVNDSSGQYHILLIIADGQVNSCILNEVDRECFASCGSYKADSFMLSMFSLLGHREYRHS